MRKKEEKTKARTIHPWLVIGLVIGTLIVTMAMPTPQLQQTDEGEWQVVWKGNIASAAEADPGSGASGFLSIYCHPHAGNPATDYNQNTSGTLETNCTDAGLSFANADSFSENIASETAFDFVVRVRYNKTHCWDGAKFIDTRCRVNLTATSSDWADGENVNDATGTLVISRNNTGDDYIWVNVYWNADDNNGYQLSDDGTITVSEISIEAKY